MMILLIFSVLIFIMNPCHSQDCEAVNSLKHGKLALGRSANPSLKCISNLVFENKKTGKKFCLDKKGKKNRGTYLHKQQKTQHDGLLLQSGK